MNIKITLKSSKRLQLFLLCMVILTACGKHNKSEASAGKTYRQTINLEADAGWKEVMLTSLKAAIDDIEQNADWLSVTKMSYSSGSPTIRLDYDKNTGDERQTNINVIDKGENILIITVKQVKQGDTPKPDTEPETDPNYSINDTHDTVTDQPANSRHY